MASSFTFFLSVLVGLLLLQLSLEIYGRGYRDNLGPLLGETRSRLPTYDTSADQHDCTPRGTVASNPFAMSAAGATGVAPPTALSQAMLAKDPAAVGSVQSPMRGASTTAGK